MHLSYEIYAIALQQVHPKFVETYTFSSVILETLNCRRGGAPVPGPKLNQSEGVIQKVKVSLDQQVRANHQEEVRVKP